MQFITLLMESALVAAALAPPAAVEPPSKTIERRATTICGQWDSVVTGTYTLYQDLWGESAATSGSQCSTFSSLSGNNIAWSTNWTWAGGPSSVKSYANIVVTQSTGYQISTISSIPSIWIYSYTGTSIVADVAYDIFTSSTATGTNEYEIMIWLAALGGAGPISSTGSPVATPTIAGVSWKLFSGPNGNTEVFSFVAASEITNFSGDLKLFLTYLAANQGFSTGQYVTSIGAGTEPFTGSNAVLSVSAYSVNFNFVGMGTTTSVASTKTSSITSSTKASTTTTNKASSTTSKATTPTSAPLYGQCGGTGWTGPTTCATGTCTYSNPWYSQCLA